MESAFSSHIVKDVNMHSKIVYDLKWNFDGSYIGSVSADKTVKIGQFDQTGSAKTLHTVPMTSTIAQICWHPSDTSRFALCGDDKAVELWDVRASRASMKIPSLGSNININWSYCENYLVVGNKNDNVAILDIRNSTIKKRKFNYEVNELVWTGNSEYILAATGGDGVGSIDLLKYTPCSGEIDIINTISAHSSNCVSIKLDSTGQRMAVGSLDFLVSLWYLDDLICHHTIAMESEIRSISYSPDGQYIATVAEEPYVLISNADSGEYTAKVNHKHKMTTLAWHPKQNLIAIAADDRTSSTPQYLKFINFVTN